MIILKLIFGLIFIIIGLRMVGVAVYSFFNGKVLKRKGLKTAWVPAPPETNLFKLMFRDVLMGILFVILGIALMI